MRFFKWVRYWYRRLRFGAFNEVTIPAMAQPFPKIDAATLCSVNPMQAPELSPDIEWVPKEVTTTEALKHFHDSYRLFVDNTGEWLHKNRYKFYADPEMSELAGYSIEQMMMERFNLLFYVLLGKHTSEEDFIIAQIQRLDRKLMVYQPDILHYMGVDLRSWIV